MWKETEGEPTSVRRAKALAYYLDTVPIFIRPNHLLVGYQAESPEAMTFNVEHFAPKIIEGYINQGFVRPNEVDELCGYLEYWKTRNLQSMLDNYYFTDEEKKLINAGHRYLEASSAENSTFTQPDHDMYLDKGLNNLLEQLREKLAHLLVEREKCDMSPDLVEICNKINDVNAMIIAAEAVIRWANRYSKLAAEMAKNEPDPARKEELMAISEICAWVPANPARNFWEAL
ncbi:MAG: hypothetical protein M1308_17640, partial [Actinobacteria bacterium]|nr:hypothetical protein [Actinomycetota bacterium]